jgi:hypothetical protein
MATVRPDGSYLSVSIETRAGHEEVDLDAIDGLVDILAAFGGVGLAVGSGGLFAGPSATIGVPTAILRSGDPGDALVDAVRIATSWFLDACHEANVGHAGIARVDLMTADYLEADLLRVPDALLGVAEVAAELGVSRQRLSELRRRPDFPAPVSELAAGPVWSGSSLRRFIEGWDRKPGRPRRSRSA